MKRGDSLAPTCASCHGMHDIRAAKDPLSPVSPLKVPFTCGKCHQEGSRGDAAAQHPPGPHPRELLGVDPRRGAAQEGPDRGRRTAPPATPPTTSCPTPTPPPRSRAATSRAPAPPATPSIEDGAPQGDQGRAVGEGGPRPARLRRLPPAAQGAQGLLHAGHGRRRLPEVPPGEGPQGEGRARDVRGRRRSSQPRATPRSPAAQCHSEVERLAPRPCETITTKVDCGACHTEVAQQYTRQPARQAHRRRRPERPDVQGVPRRPTASLGKLQSSSPTFPTNVPKLCARAATARARRRPCGTRGPSTASSRPTPRASTARGCSRAA